MCRRPQEQAPKWQIEPPEVFRMPLMLQVVKNRYLAAGREHWRSKSWIEQNIQAVARQLDWQDDLFPQNTRRAEARMYSLRLPVKVRLPRDQVRVRLQIGQHKILIG